MKRFLIILTTLLLSVGRASAVRSLDMGEMADKFPYVVVLDGDTAVNIPDSLFYRISRKVIFPVNKYEIPYNSSFRREVVNELMPYMNSITYRLHSIVIRGAASPEGPYSRNVFLSEQRKNAMLELIKSQSTMPIDSKLTTVDVPEDYMYLLRLMKERKDKDYDKVAEIVNKWWGVDPHMLKGDMMRLEGGKIWRRLLYQYFPEMRAARVVLVFKKYEIPPMEPPKYVQPEFTFTPIFSPADIDYKTNLARRELLSVKTNLLYDVAYMPGYNRWCPIPNVAIEYYPLRGHFTFGASIDFPWWQNYDDHKYFQVRNYQVESRYYFKTGDILERGYGNGPAFRGWYLSAYGNLGLYGICFDANRGWEGEGVGGGLGFGYVMPLSKNGNWRLEFAAQFGFFWTKYDPYQYECPVDPDENDNLYYYKWTGEADLFKKRQHRFTWIGPTRIGITLSYDLLYRKRYKNGASFRNRE